LPEPSDRGLVNRAQTDAALGAINNIKSRRQHAANGWKEIMSDEKEFREPGISRKTINFVWALTKHALDGGKKVEDVVYQKRLEICRSCSSCDTARMVCRDMNCGCKVTRKAKWRSESCPLDKWPFGIVDSSPDQTAAEAESDGSLR